MWDSVNRGEEKNIFPYQEEADSMFNSSLIYELSVQFFDNRHNDNKSEDIELADSLVNVINRVYFD